MPRQAVHILFLIILLSGVAAASAAAPAAGPDLVPYAPPGYPYPVVPDSVKGGVPENTALYAGHNTHFDWHARNIGDAAAGANFHVEVRIDNVQFIRYPYPDAPTGWVGGFDDWSHPVMTPGWHTISIVVDPDNVIAESDESNNVWQRDFYWEEVNAWWAEYFNNMDLAGDPVLVRDEFINFQWPGSPGPGVNADGFSVRWTRSDVLNATTYQFTLTRDNGMRFYFDEVLVYDEWTDTVDLDQVSFNITPGQHTMRVEMFEAGGDAVARFQRKPCFTVTRVSAPTNSGNIAIGETPDCLTKYSQGQTITLTAQPNTGYGFSHWSGAVSGSQNPASLLVQRDDSVTANFNQTGCYTLTTSASPAGGGTVTPTPSPNCAGGKYTHGTIVSLTANPSPGYTFANWSGGVTGTANPRNITMNGNKSVTANFSAVCYALTRNVNPAGGGSITSSPVKSPDCPANGQYTSGAVVSLTANPSPGYTFANWSGAVSGTANPRNVTMDGNKSVTANFSADCYSLTRNVNPAAGGNIIASPVKSAGCPVDYQYTHGTSVSLLADANTGYTFTNWGGALSGTQNPKSLTMDGHKSVTAAFSVDCYTLTRSVSPVSSGSMTPTPLKSDECPSNYQYTYGTAVSLMALAADGYTFSHWSGDLSGSQNPRTVTMDSHKSVTAHFSEVTADCYLLQLDHVGDGTEPAPTPTKSAACVGQRQYVEGEAIELTANPADGWHVARWEGTSNDASTLLNNAVVMPRRDHMVQVVYERDVQSGAEVYLPLGLTPICTFDPDEREDNDNKAQAKGPLCSGIAYFGLPDDQYDTFFLNTQGGTIVVELTHYPIVGGVQFHLHFEEITQNPIGRDDNGADGYRITLNNAPAGRYYILISNAQPPGGTVRYRLTAGFAILR